MRNLPSGFLLQTGPVAKKSRVSVSKNISNTIHVIMLKNWTENVWKKEYNSRPISFIHFFSVFTLFYFLYENFFFQTMLIFYNRYFISRCVLKLRDISQYTHTHLRQNMHMPREVNLAEITSTSQVKKRNLQVYQIWDMNSLFRLNMQNIYNLSEKGNLYNLDLFVNTILHWIYPDLIVHVFIWKVQRKRTFSTCIVI